MPQCSGDQIVGHVSASERRLGPDRPGLAVRFDLSRVAVPGQCSELGAGGLAEQVVERLPGDLGEFADRADPPLGQTCLGDRTDPPHQFDRQRVQKLEFTFRFDVQQPVGLGDLGGDLGEVLGSSDADRHGQPDLLPDPRANRHRHLRRCPEQVG